MSGKGAHEGRPYVRSGTRMGGGRGRGSRPGLGVEDEDGFLPPSSRGQALRGNDGGSAGMTGGG